MNRETMTRKIAEYFKTQPVLKAWLFGSFARGEEREDSDVDLLILPDKSQHFSLFTLSGMYEDLKDLLGCEVDLITDGGLMCLNDMIQAIDTIFQYVGNLDMAAFVADKRTYHAVIYNIMIMGEAANMLTHEFRDAHPETQWRQVTNMRNFLIHGYHNVEEDLVWEAITQDLAPLREQLEKYLTETNWEQK